MLRRAQPGGKLGDFYALQKAQQMPKLRTKTELGELDKKEEGQYSWTKLSREKGVGGDEEGEGSRASKDSFVGHC